MVAIITNVIRKNKFHEVVPFFEWFVYIESESIVRLGKRRRAVVKTLASRQECVCTSFDQRRIDDEFIN